MKSTIRTFIAVDLDPEVRRNAARLIKRLRPDAPMVKWVEPTTLHMTLKFIGEVSDQDVYTICKSVRRITEEHRSFRLRCRGLGAFPKPQRPRVIWVGVEEETGELAAIQSKLETTMGELGYVQDLRPYQAHITIGRIPQRGYRPLDFVSLTSGLTESQVDLGESDISETIVYSSDLAPSGPEYTVMSRTSLQS